MANTDQTRDSGDTIIAIEGPPVLHALALDLEDPAIGERVQDTQFKIRLANTEGRRSNAAFLIKRRYAWRGYSVSEQTGNLADRITLAAFSRDQPMATITVGVDSANGLSVEALYPDEIKVLRTDGKRLCEFTKLAVEDVVRSKAVLAAIFHIAYIYAHRIRACTDLLIEVNPRHVRFYRAMLGFQKYGQQRMDPRVSAPAILLRLNLAHAEAQIAKFGGHAELADQVRLLYPLFFSPQEESGIEGRLRSLD